MFSFYQNVAKNNIWWMSQLLITTSIFSIDCFKNKQKNDTGNLRLSAHRVQIRWRARMYLKASNFLEKIPIAQPHRAAFCLIDVPNEKYDSNLCCPVCSNSSWAAYWSLSLICQVAAVTTGWGSFNGWSFANAYQHWIQFF